MTGRIDAPDEIVTPGPRKDAPAEPPAGHAGAKPPKHGVPKEIGGPEGPEPTRYGDWERKGRCIDF